MTDVFISYASHDRPVVSRLVEVLQANGYSVWWDRAIQPGQRFDRSIDSALDRARVVVTVWSTRSVDSDWVRWESGEALLSGRLLPVRIDDARLPSEFQRTQTLDLRHFTAGGADPDGELNRLLAAIPPLIEAQAAREPAARSEPESSAFDAPRELGADPSIAVMPFRNQSSDAEYDYFADGLSEDLVHALALWRSFPVISYASTSPYRNQTYSLTDVAAVLGAKYLVTGQVRRSGSKIRVFAELTDAPTNRLIWRQRWTGELKEFFELQEEISTWIATHIQPHLVAEAREAAVRKRPADMNAWDLGLRAHVEWCKHGRETNLKARELAERALELDPTSAFAQVTLAETYYHEVFYRWTDDVLGAIVKYRAAAERAYELAPEDANASVQRGMAYMLMQERDRAMESLENAIELNPYFPLAHMMLGQLLVLAGSAEAGIAHLLEGMKYSPNHDSSWGDYGALALGYYVAGDYLECMVQAERCASLRPQFPLGWAVAAAAAHARGDAPRARGFVEQMLVHNPEVSKHELLFVWMGSPEPIRERFVADLAGAGYTLGESVVGH